jgi:4-methyl-5(b-hydroxyethyl)-thiazole monophosphate biosynthesis
MVLVLLADGFEEIEALTPIDVLRRAGLTVKSCGLSGVEVRGSHGIYVKADVRADEVNPDEIDMLILPGGMPGATNIDAHPYTDIFIDAVKKNGGRLAAICAAPLVFGRLGILEGRRATCYPSFENELLGALLSEKAVERDGHVVTGAGMGASFELGCALIELLDSAELAEKVKMSTMVDGKKL